jgi:putative flippase GtrA
MRRFYHSLETLLGARFFKILRYLIAGGTAAASHLLFLFLFVEYGGMQYVVASTAGFICAICVSFGMQKFLTFRDKPTHDMHTQFGRYLVVTGANLGLNTLLMYLLVTAGMWYILAQTFTTIVVAVTGYFGYSYFVFRDRTVLPQ